MNERDDPFMGLLDLFEGKSKRSIELGRWVDWLFDTVLSNFYVTVYFFTSIFILLLFVSPILMRSQNPDVVNIGSMVHVSAGLFYMCHQMPYRSFIIQGVPIPVCARDTGIYIGFILGFASLFLKQRPKFLSSVLLPIVCTVPMALDGFTQLFGWRESNNVLRFMTGIVFAFGIVAYICYFFILRKNSRFREEVVGIRMVVDFLVAAALMHIILGGVIQELDLHYLSPYQAISKAMDYSNIASPYAVETYYVSARAPLTVTFDPFYRNHEDVLLDDILKSDWLKQQIVTFVTIPKATILNETPDDSQNVKDLLIENARVEHRYGLWTVVILSGPPVRGNAPYIANGTGEYYYFDGITGDLVMRRTH